MQVFDFIPSVLSKLTLQLLMLLRENPLKQKVTVIVNES
jgi:hypothetical protein